jgi:hypothetical protein
MNSHPWVNRILHNNKNEMNQEQLNELLLGKKIAKIKFAGEDKNNLTIESILLDSGELLSLNGNIKISHPEYEEELAAFNQLLNNVPPSGIISFKAKYLSQGVIEREISKTHRRIKSNGYGQISNTRLDYISYRFDMPEK